ncbi:hypothetical protein GGQ69_000485 [Micrococcus sp. TA1]|nr:hypothetical protein [Micrococcus sp. TA1]
MTGPVIKSSTGRGAVAIMAMLCVFYEVPCAPRTQ